MKLYEILDRASNAVLTATEYSNQAKAKYETELDDANMRGDEEEAGKLDDLVGQIDDVLLDLSNALDNIEALKGEL